MTQRQVADIIGVDRSFISHIERQGRTLRLDQLARLAHALALSDAEIAALVRAHGPDAGLRRAA